MNLEFGLEQIFFDRLPSKKKREQKKKDIIFLKMLLLQSNLV